MEMGEFLTPALGILGEGATVGIENLFHARQMAQKHAHGIRHALAGHGGDG